MRLNATWAFEAVAALLALMAAYAYAGTTGAYGMALGILVPGFTILATWGVIRLLGKQVVAQHKPAGDGVEEDGRAKPPGQAGCVVLAFLLKVPVIGLGVYAAGRLGEGTSGCFLAGVGLVYFALVLRVTLDARSQDRIQR